MKFREINRYHVYLVLFSALVFAVLLVFRAEKACGHSQGRYGHYCSLEETWRWLEAGANGWFWTMLVLMALVGLGALLGSDKRRR